MLDTPNDPEMLRAADRKRLERLARRVETNRASLRQAMRDAQQRGASLREIAQATGMSHTSVGNWLREHDQGDTPQEP